MARSGARWPPWPLAKRGEGSADALWNDPAWLEFNAAMQAYLRETDSVAVHAINAQGQVLASQIQDYMRRRVSDEVLAHLHDVFSGETRFLRPYPEKDRIVDARVVGFSRPIAWIVTPVHDEEGRIVAALGLGKDADARFGGLLKVARPGDSGEAYAFDAHGLMISESRFTSELQVRGWLPAGTSSMFRIEIRDPGADGDNRPRLDAGARRPHSPAGLRVAEGGA